MKRRSVLCSGASLIAAGATILNSLPSIAATLSDKSVRFMRAYEVGELGRKNYGLRIVRRPVPDVAAGQVLLRVHATGLNARDLALLRGLRIYGGVHDPTRIPLDDNACEVLALGAGVTDFKIGDRVLCTHFPLWLGGPWDDVTMSGVDFGVNTNGFLAEQVAVPAQGLVRIPREISYQAAATFPNAGLTAWHAVMVAANLQAGETMVTLGTGGVSVFGMQWAKLRGAKVAITSSQDTKLVRMRELGAEITINYRNNPDWHHELLELTQGRGADVVLNTVGIAELERCLLACNSNGRVMVIGANSVTRGKGTATTAEFTGLKVFPRAMIMRGLTIRGIIVGSRQMLADALQAAASAGLLPVIDRVFSFEHAREAITYMESGEKIGKIIISI